MKIRQGFVSNSSSSSFIVFKNGLSNEQIEMIKDHYSIAKRLCEQGTQIEYMYDYEDCWHITETETDLTLEGSTYMDNFDMSEYLTDFVMVDEKYIRWEY